VVRLILTNPKTTFERVPLRDVLKKIGRRDDNKAEAEKVSAKREPYAVPVKSSITAR
jgi:hypothetical protein